MKKKLFLIPLAILGLLAGCTGEAADGTNTGDDSKQSGQTTPTSGQTTPSSGESTPTGSGTSTPSGETSSPTGGGGVPTTPTGGSETTPTGGEQTSSPTGGHTTPTGGGETSSPTGGSTTPTGGETTPTGGQETPTGGQTTPTGGTTTPTGGTTTPTGGETTPSVPTTPSEPTLPVTPTEPSVSPTPSEEIPEAGYGIVYYGEHKEYVPLVYTMDLGDYKWYFLGNAYFTAGQEFAMYHSENNEVHEWLIALDPESFDGHSADYLSVSNNHYVVLQDFFANVHFELKYNEDKVLFDLNDIEPTEPTVTPSVTPTPSPSEEPEDVFGLVFYGEKPDYIPAEDIGYDGGYHQFKLYDYPFDPGDRFAMYHRVGDNVSEWVPAVDDYSFGQYAVSDFLSEGSDYISVIRPFSADVYLKIKDNSDLLYFEATSIGPTPSPLPSPTPSVTPSEPVTPTPTEVLPEEYGLVFYGDVKSYIDATYVGVFQDHDCYEIESMMFKEGDEFAVYHFDGSSVAEWTPAINAYSFNGHTEEYLNIEDNKYVVLQDFEAYVGMMFKYEDDQIGFELQGIEPTVTPTPTPSEELPEEGFGLVFFYEEGNYYVPSDADNWDNDFHQYIICFLAFEEGEEFAMYHCDGKKVDVWTVDIDTYSFDGNVDDFVVRDGDVYRVVNTFIADVYLKIKDKADQIYFELQGIEPTVTPTPTLTPSEPVEPSITPTPSEPIEPSVIPTSTEEWEIPAAGYGIFNYIDFIPGTHVGQEGEYDQYLLEDFNFTEGMTFCLYTSDGVNLPDTWGATVDGASFGGDIESYLEVHDKYYVVVQDFTADVYIKLKYGEDQIYFGLEGVEPSVTPTPSEPVEPSLTPTATPTEEPEYFTIYIKDEINWTNKGGLHISIDGENWLVPVLTTGDEIALGEWKIEIAADSANELYFWFTNEYGQYRHPNNAAEGCSKDEYDSSINIGELELTAGEAYVLTITEDAYHYDNWVHAWFNYTFAELA